MHDQRVRLPGSSPTPRHPGRHTLPGPQSTESGETARPWLHEPGDPAYADAAPWNGAITSQPRAVALVESADDVVAAVRYAAVRKLRVAVRCTGHGATPVGDDTLLVHTKLLSACVVDPVERQARVGAGASWRQVVDAAAAHGLAPICGAAPDVGVVGYLTGGGLGPLARTYGISSDRVLAMDVVTGAEQRLHVTPTLHEDLFWGLRGGRSSLGIITSIDIALVALQEFYGGSLFFSAGDAPAVLHAWRSWASSLPDQATTSVAVLRLPAVPTLPPQLAGRQVLAIRFAWAGDQRDAEQCLGELNHGAVPLLDDVRIRPYNEIGAVHNDPVAPRPVRYSSALLGELPDEAVDRLLDSVGEDDNVQSVVELRLLGGAIARPSEHPSAVCHRDAAYLLFTSGPADPASGTAEHSGRIHAALAPWTEAGLSPNFVAPDEPDQMLRCYDTDTLLRLRSLAHRYDPNHVLTRRKDSS